MAELRWLCCRGLCAPMACADDGICCGSTGPRRRRPPALAPPLVSPHPGPRLPNPPRKAAAPQTEGSINMAGLGRRGGRGGDVFCEIETDKATVKWVPRCPAPRGLAAALLMASVRRLYREAPGGRRHSHRDVHAHHGDRGGGRGCRHVCDFVAPEAAAARRPGCGRGPRAGRRLHLRLRPRLLRLPASFGCLVGPQRSRIKACPLLLSGYLAIRPWWYQSDAVPPLALLHRAATVSTSYLANGPLLAIQSLKPPPTAAAGAPRYRRAVDHWASGSVAQRTMISSSD